MIVLKIIGIVLLSILCLGIVFAVLLMYLPARIELRRRMPDGPLRIRIGFGPVKRVWTPGQKRKRKPETEKKPEKAPEKPKTPKKPHVPMVDFHRLDYEQVFSLGLTLLDDLTGMMTWERLHFTLILHTPDAAQTGNLLGLLSALTGNLYPYLERAFVLKDTKIILDADFDADNTVWGADISVMTRLGRFPRILWRRRKPIWALWKSIRLTKEEKIKWKREHTAPQSTD